MLPLVLQYGHSMVTLAMPRCRAISASGASSRFLRMMTRCRANGSGACAERGTAPRPLPFRCASGGFRCAGTVSCTRAGVARRSGATTKRGAPALLSVQLNSRTLAQGTTKRCVPREAQAGLLCVQSNVSTLAQETLAQETLALLCVQSNVRTLAQETLALQWVQSNIRTLAQGTLAQGTLAQGLSWAQGPSHLLPCVML
jgi:hypothetical protein